MSAPAVLFDIDGTLIDSNYLHVHAWTKAFDKIGHPIDSARIHRGVGLDSKKMLADLLADEDDKIVEKVKKYHQKYYERLAGRLRPFAGARELLQELQSRGWQVVLATSAPPAELELLRPALDADAFLTHITSGEDVENAKPDPDLMHVALDRAGVSADRAVMVGDTIWDGQAAGKAGVRFVGVRSGGIGEAELRGAGAIEVWADPADLLAHLDISVLGRPTP